MIPELRESAEGVIPKRRFSGFFETNPEERLRELRPEKIIIVGDCTNICVYFTAADARAMEYEVEVPSQCVGAVRRDGPPGLRWRRCRQHRARR